MNAGELATILLKHPDWTVVVSDYFKKGSHEPIIEVTEEGYGQHDLYNFYELSIGRNP